MKIEKVFVIGAGLMGSGIAQVCASSGLDVILCDVTIESVERALKNIEWSAGKFVNKEIIEGPLESIMARITPTDNLNEAAEAQICIEAIFEIKKVKKILWYGRFLFGETSKLTDL